MAGRGNEVAGEVVRSVAVPISTRGVSRVRGWVGVLVLGL